ncbi:MAG: DUF748 domain-containing protein [Candidatus Omnitrophota bacterium]|nr:DUF748 domain-containing protein [Candidatus Omnitrophota bacterium]
MIKKIIIVLLLIVIIAAAALYIYRYAIVRHYAEKIIRENLPEYIKIDKINFDFTNNKVSLSNFRILNPPEFSSNFLINIKETSCKYSILGKGMPTGLEISDVLLNGADIRIERLSDGRVNAVEMESFIQSFPPKEDKQVNSAQDKPYSEGPNASQTLKEATGLMNKKLSDLIKLPTSFDIKGSKLMFIDRVPYETPYVIAIGSINGQISIGFGGDYSRITSLSFTLSGLLNGYEREKMQWVGSLDPNAQKITMSNRFEVSGLNLLTFQPYYDSLSPFVFKRGRFSGTLIFDLNNGEVGSTNEVHLSNLAFMVKPGYENSQMWGTTVPELLSYFTSPSGEIVFDFKLKGDMAHPTPYLGPISKRALTSMAIDKITSYAIDQVSNQQSGAGGQVDKAKEAIDMVRQLLKKK